MQSELAVRLGRFPGIVLFSGDAKDASGKDDLTPEELAREHHKYPEAWNMILESIVKGGELEKPQSNCFSKPTKTQFGK